MQLIDEDVAERDLRRHGSRHRDVRRLGRQHRGRARVVRRPGRRSSGKVRDDQLGEVFAHDIRSIGVEFDVPPADRRAGRRRVA